MAEMTVTQALKRMSKLRGRFAEDRKRASENVNHLGEETPAYRFDDCLQGTEATRVELLKLKTAVSLSNAKQTVDWDGKKEPLVWALAVLREWAGDLKWLEGLPVKSQEKTFERSREFDGEKYVQVPTTHICHLPMAKRDERKRHLQDEYDQLNDLVTSLNNRTMIEV